MSLRNGLVPCRTVEISAITSNDVKLEMPHHGSRPTGLLLVEFVNFTIDVMNIVNIQASMATGGLHYIRWSFVAQPRPSCYILGTYSKSLFNIVGDDGCCDLSLDPARAVVD